MQRTLRFHGTPTIDLRYPEQEKKWYDWHMKGNPIFDFKKYYDIENLHEHISYYTDDFLLEPDATQLRDAFNAIFGPKKKWKMPGVHNWDDYVKVKLYRYARTH